MLISNSIHSFCSGCKTTNILTWLKKIWLLHQICDILGKNWPAGLTKLNFLKNICTKKDQNSVFVSEAIHGEIIIWKKSIIWRGLPQPSKIFGLNWLINHSTRPQIVKFYIVTFLSSHYEPKYTTRVKVIKCFLQIFVVWNNGAEKNEGQGTHFGILSYWHFSKGEAA